jgi:hypothetical protein
MVSHSSAESVGWIWLSQIGSDHSPTVKMTNMLRLFSYRECTKGKCPQLQSGQTCEHCGGRSFWDAWTSSTAASHARTSQPQALAQAWRESEADFISNSKELSEKQNQLSSFLKMSLQSGHADLVVWCGDFPSSGMTVAGQLFQPRKLEPRSKAKDGFSWPRPKAMDWKDWNYKKTHGRHSPRLPVWMWATLGGWPTVRLLEWLMNYPARWTKLEPWATAWSESKRAKRSTDSQDSEINE